MDSGEGMGTRRGEEEKRRGGDGENVVRREE
jgi:hypothetical protein